jgi:hypothetical protein
VAADVAVADGKWELRGLTDGNGKVVPTTEGFVTVVVRRDGGWRIEAYRYTIKAPPAGSPPILLKRPGFPGGT